MNSSVLMIGTARARSAPSKKSRKSAHSQRANEGRTTADRSSGPTPLYSRLTAPLLLVPLQERSVPPQEAPYRGHPYSTPYRAVTAPSLRVIIGMPHSTLTLTVPAQYAHTVSTHGTYRRFEYSRYLPEVVFSRSGLPTLNGPQSIRYLRR